MNAPMQSRYREIYRRSMADPEGFWAEAAGEIDWTSPGDKVFDPDAGVYGRWFAGARLQHLPQRRRPPRRARARRAGGDHLRQPGHRARSAASPMRELHDEVAALGAVLQDLGVGKGDRVIIYMPMIPEAVVAMLACARIGAIHSVVFGGFAANELATRIDDAKPKVDPVARPAASRPARVVAYKPLLDEAIEPRRAQAASLPHPPAPAGRGRD